MGPPVASKPRGVTVCRPFAVVDVEQNTPEWLAARVGRLTASRAADMLAGGKGTSRANLLWQIVLERMTGRSHEKQWSSGAQQRGLALEPQAVSAYDELTGVLVRRCGFLQHTTLPAGASPDGYLGDFEILVSVKCREAKAHAEHLLNGAIPNDAYQQMRHELWLTGATDHHYVSYNPDFPEGLQLRVHVLKAKDMNLPAYDAEVRKFLAEVATAETELRKRKQVA